MRALIQRVKRCTVSVDGQPFSNINVGLLVLLAVKKGDTMDDAHYLAERCCALRVFDDEEGKMNVSVKDIGGEMMIVSQFTLYGDTRKGNRPSYSEAAAPELAEQLYTDFINESRRIIGNEKVSSGQFRAMMQVEIVNDGPVTVMIESKEKQSG